MTGSTLATESRHKTDDDKKQLAAEKMGGNSGGTQTRDVLKAGVGKISSPALQLKEGSLPNCA